MLFNLGSGEIEPATSWTHRYVLAVIPLGPPGHWMNETNTKWIIINLDKIEKRFKELEHKILIIRADITLCNSTRNNYLPRELISVFWGKSKLLVQKENVVKRNLGNWMAVKLKCSAKTIAIINTYRLPATSSNGPKYSLIQYNVIERK